MKAFNITRQQVVAFLELTIGSEVHCAAGDEAFDRPRSPQLHAFLQGAIGDIPRNCYGFPAHERGMRYDLSCFLREMADAIDRDGVEQS